jgi:predicted lactoylglutathione lyase
MSVTPRLSLVTLGVADVAASTAFYERLGWQRSSSSQDGVVSFFQLTGCALGLFGRADLAADARVGSDGAGFRAVSLAVNLGSTDEVDAAYADWVAAGATEVKPPEHVDWGGYSSYVADPDGHLWELAHNPFWEIDATGVVQLPR